MVPAGFHINHKALLNWQGGVPMVQIVWCMWDFAPSLGATGGCKISNGLDNSFRDDVIKDKKILTLDVPTSESLSKLLRAAHRNLFSNLGCDRFLQQVRTVKI